MANSNLYCEFYNHWLAKRVDFSVVENDANCDNCTMQKPTGLTRDKGPFQPNLKCCTYFPFVPNFSLGEMMSHPTPTQKVRIAAAFQQGIVLPIGLYVTPEYRILSQELGEEAFGNARELLCPFYDVAQNNCSSWSMRPGVCVSYLCKSSYDQAGLEFRHELENYLNAFEWALSTEVFQRMGYTDEDLEVCHEIVSCEDIAEREYLIDLVWKDRKKEQRQFFLQCREMALQIKNGELNSLLGEDFQEMELRLQEKARELKRS